MLRVVLAVWFILMPFICYAAVDVTGSSLDWRAWVITTIFGFVSVIISFLIKVLVRRINQWLEKKEMFEDLRITAEKEKLLITKIDLVIDAVEKWAENQVKFKKSKPSSPEKFEKFMNIVATVLDKAELDEIGKEKLEAYLEAILNKKKQFSSGTLMNKK